MRLNFQIKRPDSEELCGPDEPGEICALSPAAMQGYLNHPEETRRFFHGSPDGFMRTGDVAKYDKEGQLYYVDRIKELIKYVKGTFALWDECILKINCRYENHHVSPTELEDLMQTHPAVKESMAFGREDPTVQQLICMIVVLKPDFEVRLRLHLQYTMKQRIFKCRMQRSKTWLSTWTPEWLITKGSVVEFCSGKICQETASENYPDTRSSSFWKKIKNKILSYGTCDLNQVNFEMCWQYLLRIAENVFKLLYRYIISCLQYGMYSTDKNLYLVACSRWFHWLKPADFSPVMRRLGLLVRLQPIRCKTRTVCTVLSEYIEYILFRVIHHAKVWKRPIAY